MKTLINQLQLNFEAPVKVTRIVSERSRDSLGQYATDLVAANDIIERISNERDVYRTNYLEVAKQLIELQRK